MKDLNEFLMFSKSVYGKKRNTVDSYFLAGRNMNWLLVTFSIMELFFNLLE